MRRAWSPPRLKFQGVSKVMPENSFPDFRTELGTTWNLYKSKIVAFVLIALVGVVAMSMAGGGWLWLSSKIIPQNSIFIFVMPILGLPIFLLPMVWMGAAFLFVMKPDRGVVEAYKLAFPRLLGMLWLWFLMSLFVSGGFTLLLLPGLVFCIWFSFSWYVLVDEGLGAIDALVQSREYVRGRFFVVAGRLLAVWVGSFVISFIIALVLTLVGLQFVAVFICSFVGLFPIIYSYTLYQSLRAQPDVVRVDALSRGDKFRILRLGLICALIGVSINIFYTLPKKISAMKAMMPGTDTSFIDIFKATQEGKEGEKAREAVFGGLRESMLKQMAAEGNTEFIKNMLETEGVSIETKNEHGLTPLLLASWKGHADTVEVLLAKGADIEAKNKDGLTALMYTAENGHTEILQTLLTKGASTEAKNREGITALMYAAGNDHVRSIRALLATVEIKVETFGMTASFPRSDINAINNNGNTALMFAVSEGHVDSVLALLAHGADTKIRDNDGDTALTIAERRGLSNIVQMLK